MEQTDAQIQAFKTAWEEANSKVRWYQPSLDQRVAYCGSCGRETEYDGRSWKCQDCSDHDERT